MPGRGSGRIAWIRAATCLGMLAALAVPAAQAGSVPKVRLVVWGYNPQWGDTPRNQLCLELMREDPELLIAPWNALQIEGPRGNSTRLLAYAGQTAPDVDFSHWHEIQNDIAQGFLCPLNEYIGYDGFYGLDPATGRPTERTGKPKWRRDPATGRPVPDRNDMIDDDEALWPEWVTLPKINRFVASGRGRLERGPDGQPYEGVLVYGIPWGQPIYHGLVYRRDLLRQAGLQEDAVPRTWEEFWRFVQRLTDPRREVPGARFQRGQRGFALPPSGWQWLQWLYAANGDCIMQAKTNPRTGKEHWYRQEETEFVDPETGESLAQQPSRWKATFAGPAGQAACRFYHKLCWQRWIRHPQTGDPIDLTEADLKAGQVKDPATGQMVRFRPEEVIVGAVRALGPDEDNWADMFRRGEVAVIMWDMRSLQQYKVPPQNLGFCPVPAPAGGQPVVGSFRHYNVLSSTLARPDRQAARDKAWKVLSTVCGRRGRELAARDTVLQGYARFMTPQELREFGLEEYIEQIPRHWRDHYDEAVRNARAEPFKGYWYPIDAQMARKVIGFIFSDEHYDYLRALKELEDEANTRIMFGLPEEIKARYRPIAFVGVCLAVVAFVLAGRIIVRTHREKDLGARGLALRPASARNVHSRWLPLVMLAPAVLSILLWQYYPLVRGSVMAFQDYRIVGTSSWVGLDNFITTFASRDFYVYLSKTFKFVALSLGLCFFTPIFLAVLLNEVPRGKTLFRTIYFLPQVSSGLVVLFIWKLMYNPTEYGLLNQLLLAVNRLGLGWVLLIKMLLLAVTALVFWTLYRIAFTQEHESWKGRAFWTALALGATAAVAWRFLDDVLAVGLPEALQQWATWLWRPFGLQAQKWLQDPRWAMIAVILPGMWASAGMGSLIYLAALKNVDDEMYEAAEIDGAGFFHKLWYITLPFLKPLIIINFVGAFIGTFTSMGNIFAMTGGGPGDETAVLSLAIWFAAFAELDFGRATAMAWVTGLLLISFTVYQLRILKKVEFRRAESF